MSSRGPSPDPDTIKAIHAMAPPTTVKAVRAYLGTCGYYRSCLPNYAHISDPLIALTRKHVRFHWTKSCQTAFEKLKHLLLSSHVMRAPNPHKHYRWYKEASDYPIGGILVQQSDDGVEKVVQYISHIMSPTQRKWPIIEKVAFAVVDCVTKLRRYIYGVSFPCLTDHKPLR